VKTSEVLRAWGSILQGRSPSLSLEITRECPLRCPGCYAYEEKHLGDSGLQLRTLADHKGDDLVRRVLSLVDEHRPLHLSIVGGDPLVRFRELDQLLPQLSTRGIHVQVVTSAFRPLPLEWRRIPRLNLVVSIDGLQPEHDIRRRPATYDRILKHIAGHQITVHCTVTAQMTQRAGYLREFTALWSANPDVKRIWFSLFTPQVGAQNPETLTFDQRDAVLRQLLELRRDFPKLDMPEGLIEHLAKPPASPAECIFAQTTTTISADLKTRITPCQFGGTPDCSRCGCIATAALGAVGGFKVIPGVTAGDLFHISAGVGKKLGKKRAAVA